MITNEGEPRNIPGYIALVRHVLDYYSDEELAKRALLTRHLVLGSHHSGPFLRLLDPDPSPEQLLTARLERIERDPNWKVMRERLDELQQMPMEAKPLVSFVDEALVSLEEVEAELLRLRFNLDSPEAEIRTWREVGEIFGRKSSPQERGEKVANKLRKTRTFQKVIPDFLIPTSIKYSDPKITPFNKGK